MLTNASGAVLQRYDYDPYGTTTQTSTAYTNPYQYTGREKDQSGLYYYRARYYKPQWGRFISEDPIRLAGGYNSYIYASASPTQFTDPLGLWSLQVGGYIPLILDGPFGPGGSVTLVFDGLDLTAISFKGGFGAGGGLSIDPFGGAPDPNACPGSNSLGVYAEAGFAFGPIVAGHTWRYGGTQSFDANGHPQWSEYGGGGHDAAIDPGSWSGKWGAAATVGVGVEVTHNF